MGMDVVDLINHLRLEAPCDEYYVPHASDGNAPPQEMSLLMRGKLLIRERTLSGNPLKKMTPR